jgi:hypothetical protein
MSTRSPDRIDPLVVGHDGDLGARTRITGTALDLQQALLDLGHLLAEQLHHEGRGRTRQHDLRAAQRGINLDHHGPHAVAAAQVFLRDQLAALQAPFDTTALDDEIALVETLDRAGEDLVATRQEIVQQLLALGIADLLQDDLLGRLRADPADGHGLDRLFEVVAHVDVVDLFLGLEVEDLGFRLLQTRFVRHHMPAAESLVGTRFAVNRDADIDFAFIEFLGGRCQCQFDGTKHDFTIHVFLTRDRIHQHQQFAVHSS